MAVLGVPLCASLVVCYSAHGVYCTHSAIVGAIFAGAISGGKVMKGLETVLST